MRFSVKSLFVLAAVPVTVLACEGECIVSITNAFLGNYTTPVNDVLFSIVRINCSTKHLPDLTSYYVLGWRYFKFASQ